MTGRSGSGTAQEPGASMCDALAASIAAGGLAGAVVMAARGDEVRVETAGVQDIDTRVPMAADTLFRIASMTKPLAATAALMLVEEGRLALDAPVDALLPELANREVLVRFDGPADETAAAERPITLRHLLTMTAGWGVTLDPAGTNPVEAEIRRLGLAAGQMPPALDPDEMIARYGRLPLMHQPGARWVYHNSYDVLAVLVGRAAGQPFETVLRERVLEPLGMCDTTFRLPAGERGRLATSYLPAVGGGLAPYTDARESAPGVVHPSGTTGLVSTAGDYLAFARALHAGRLIGRESLEEMTADQIPDAVKAISPFFPGFWDGSGFGFGVATLLKPDAEGWGAGTYGWTGGLGTAWCTDPADGTIAVVLMQRGWDAETDRLHRAVRRAIRAAFAPV